MKELTEDYCFGWEGDRGKSLAAVQKETAPFVPGSQTSKAAAVGIVKGSRSLRARVMNLLRELGEYGATDEEIQDRLGMNPSTERPRRVELVNAGMVRKSGVCRPTKAGRDADVWVANINAPPSWVPSKRSKAEVIRRLLVKCLEAIELEARADQGFAQSLPDCSAWYKLRSEVREALGLPPVVMSRSEAERICEMDKLK